MLKAEIVKEGRKYILKLTDKLGNETVVYTSQSYRDCHQYMEKYVKFEKVIANVHMPTPVCKGCGSHFLPKEDEELCPFCIKALKRLGNYVTPVRYGIWLGKPTGFYEILKCSCCGNNAPTAGIMPRFCPNCGAKMESAGDEQR